MSRAKTLLHIAVIDYQVTFDGHSEHGSQHLVRAHEILILIYQMVYLQVCGDNRRALARGLFNVHVDNQGIKDTVNSEIFARVLFSRNFAFTKFRENKTLAKWRDHSAVD